MSVMAVSQAPVLARFWIVSLLRWSLGPAVAWNPGSLLHMAASAQEFQSCGATGESPILHDILLMMLLPLALGLNPFTRSPTSSQQKRQSSSESSYDLLTWVVLSLYQRLTRNKCRDTEESSS